jgi:hypothetical protein
VKALPVLGERGGSLFVAPDAGVASGALVVSEGRSLLSDGAKVVARLAEVRR